MYYVYILQSESHPNKYYTGFTADVQHRLEEHNQGKGVTTKPHRPWKLKSYVAFPDKERAIAFEKYLKTGSGRAMAIKHL